MQTVAVNSPGNQANLSEGKTGVPLAINKATGALLVEQVSSVGGQMLVSVSPTSVSELGMGLARFRSQAVSSAAIAVKDLIGAIYSLTVINPNTSPVYLKLYNKTAATVTVGTDVPQHVIAIPAGDGTSPGEVVVVTDISPVYAFSTAIAIAAVKELADAGTTAPATAIHVEAQYK